ncbi:MAG: D-glycerate dehydrogenase [Candidatus Sungbacteria bacterium]|nr:D-glycerate dehydrogenase [Candidatus Sungbacteria bacterium]
MPKIFVTRLIPDSGLKMLRDKGFELTVSPHDRVLTKEEIITELKNGYDAMLCLLTDKIDAEVMDAGLPQLKMIANYAVGFDNIDLKAAAERNLVITNTPGVLTETVAEHAFSLLLSIAHRIPESDRFTRTGKYVGWAPMLLLGTDVSSKTLGVVGLGRIGSRVAHHAVRGFGMKVLYHDPKPNPDFEKEYGAVYKEKLEDLLAEADFVSIHVPLMDSTRHLINADRFKQMKPTAYLINTSRGPIVDEAALVEALQGGTIRGAALDVYENEPQLAAGLAELENVVLTPHTASATEGTRAKMAELAARNIVEFLEGRTPPNVVKA